MSLDDIYNRMTFTNISPEEREEIKQERERRHSGAVTPTALFGDRTSISPSIIHSLTWIVVPHLQPLEACPPPSRAGNYRI